LKLYGKSKKMVNFHPRKPRDASGAESTHDNTPIAVEDMAAFRRSCYRRLVERT
jgi:hypothetical protein